MSLFTGYVMFWVPLEEIALALPRDIYAIRHVNILELLHLRIKTFAKFDCCICLFFEVLRTLLELF